MSHEDGEGIVCAKIEVTPEACADIFDETEIRTRTGLEQSLKNCPVKGCIRTVSISCTIPQSVLKDLIFKLFHTFIS